MSENVRQLTETEFNFFYGELVDVMNEMNEINKNIKSKINEYMTTNKEIIFNNINNNKNNKNGIFAKLRNIILSKNNNNKSKRNYNDMISALSIFFINQIPLSNSNKSSKSNNSNKSNK